MIIKVNLVDSKNKIKGLKDFLASSPPLPHKTCKHEMVTLLEGFFLYL
jgi:hypothetical protein